jgi:hypothetical protein
MTTRLQRSNNLLFSPNSIPAANRAAMRSRNVVPDIHTPYDFYERIYLDA